MGKPAKFFILPIVLLLLATFLRFYQLDTIPPGLAHDEAMNGVDALDAIYNGYHPLYFERNQGGREPLFIYLQTLSVYVLGATPYAMRLVPAFIGLLTVAATYALANKLFNRRTALFAAALLTVSQWHVHFSRTSFRTISFPLLEVVAVLLLWKGITSGAKRFYALGGLAAGLAMYTYFSSRLLPVLLLLFIVYLAVFYRQKIAWRGIALFAVVGTLVFLPLGLYYLTHQYIFFARIDQVSAISLSPEANSWENLGENTLNTLGMFQHLGDIYWRDNLPGKPLFDIFTFALFLAGLALAAYRAKANPALALVLIWLVVMLLPGALSVESPSYLRSLGLVPVVFILPALAVDAAWPKLSALLAENAHSFRWLLPLAALIWLAYIGVSTFRDYFQAWGQSKETYFSFDMDMNEVGRYLGTLSGDEPVLLSSKYYEHPSTLFYLRRPLDLTWFNGSQSLVFPDSGRETLYVFPYSATPPDLDQWFPAQDLVKKVPGRDGTTAFVAYQAKPSDLRQSVTQTIPQKLTGKDLGGILELVGYKAGKEILPGKTLPLDILWRVEAPPKEGANFAFFSHLIDYKGQMWGLGDANEYPTQEWRAGDLVLGHYDIDVKSNTPPGRYFVDIGVYDRLTGERLYFSDKDKSDHLQLATTKVQQAQPIAPTAIRSPLQASFAGGINLLGYDLQNGAGQAAKAGENLQITLYWQAANRQAEDYTVFLQLLDSQNKVVAQDDSQPATNSFPTTFWDPGESVADGHHLALDPSLPSGDYTLLAGLYLLKTGERLATLKDGQPVGDYVVLSKVRVDSR